MSVKGGVIEEITQLVKLLQVGNQPHSAARLLLPKSKLTFTLNFYCFIMLIVGKSTKDWKVANQFLSWGDTFSQIVTEDCFIGISLWH